MNDFFVLEPLEERWSDEDPLSIKPVGSDQPRQVSDPDYAEIAPKVGGGKKAVNRQTQRAIFFCGLARLFDAHRCGFSLRSARDYHGHCYNRRR